jgi:hypothetical protein
MDKRIAMTQPERLPENQEVTLLTTSAQAPLTTPRFTPVTGRVGPWSGGGFLICFNNPDQSNWAKPGLNVFSVDFNGFLPGKVDTINGYVTELQSADWPFPHMGDALFYTLGITLDFASQVASVTFFMAWNSPLPVGIMANIGFGPQMQPLSQLA